MYKKNKKAWYKHIDFTLLDCICIEISFILAYIIRLGIFNFKDSFEMLFSKTPYQRFMLYLALLHLVMVLFMEPYSNILYRNTAEEFKSVLKYNLWIFVGTLVITFMEQSTEVYSRIAIAIFPIIDCGLMIVSRYFLKKIIINRLNKEKNQTCMLLVTSKDMLPSILEKFKSYKLSIFRIVGIALLDYDDEISEFNGIPIVGNDVDMYEFARTNVVDEVLIHTNDGGCLEKIAKTFLSMGIATHVSIQGLVHVPNPTVNRVNGIQVVTTSVSVVTSRQYVIKRIIDLLSGIVGSVVTIIITIFVAPMIWISDPGPVFFRQDRVGRNGRVFKIWKFRTMCKDAESKQEELLQKNVMRGNMFKVEDDPRIIGYGKKFSVGKFLRKTSIDEFPQFFNILEGSMSLVGTRPPTVEEYKKYELHHKGRLAIKPGLTGLWQVSGRNKIHDFEKVVALDKMYIDNFTLKLDLEIILKTIKHVFAKDGAM